MVSHLAAARTVRIGFARPAHAVFRILPLQQRTGITEALRSALEHRGGFPLDVIPALATRAPHCLRVSSATHHCVVVPPRPERDAIVVALVARAQHAPGADAAETSVGACAAYARIVLRSTPLGNPPFRI